MPAALSLIFLSLFFSYCFDFLSLQTDLLYRYHNSVMIRYDRCILSVTDNVRSADIILTVKISHQPDSSFPVFWIFQCLLYTFPLINKWFFLIIPPSHMNGKEPVTASFRLYAEDTSRLPVLVIIRLTGQKLLHPCDWFLTEQRHSFIVFSIAGLGADPGPFIIDTAFLPLLISLRLPGLQSYRLPE